MRFFNDWKTRRRLRSTGQALILIVLTFLGLLLFLGLMIDLGQIFLAKGYLRRAADAAALSAAAQFRENRTITDMTAAAKEVANINGVDPTTIWVQTCKEGGVGSPGADSSLCHDPGKMPKKLVRVTITMDYPLTFLSLLNVYTVRLVESSISEAAAMDVVLVIDVSESMAFDTPPNYTIDYSVNERNPAVCNLDDSCIPFKSVRAAAKNFAMEILNKDPLEEEDRLAIVTFANGWQAGDKGTRVVIPPPGWTNEQSIAVAWINYLKVYNPEVICPYGEWGCNESGGPDGPACPADQASIPVSSCLLYYDQDPGTGARPYGGLHCPRTLGDILAKDGTRSVADASAISACNTTNIGGGLRLAGVQFGFEKRLDALWVVVLLTDGQANASFGTNEDVGDPGIDLIAPEVPASKIKDHLPFGFCPDGTWVGPGSDPPVPNRRYCQDGDVDDVRTWDVPIPAQYDADDFARDQAKYVACFATNQAPACGATQGQGAVIFTIGLGNEILALDDDTVNGQKPYGASLLRYIAAAGDDGNPGTDPCELEPDYNKSCGNYFFAQSGANLVRVFELIYSRIFTRLTA